MASSIIGGPLIKIARLRAGLTQRDLAERLGLPQSSIARWESGARQPTIENLVEAVRACGLDVTVGLDAVDRSNDAFIWALLDETVAERVRRQVAAANSLMDHGEVVDPIATLRELTDRGVRFVLLGRLAESVRGSPLVPGAEVVICPDTTVANRSALQRAMRELLPDPRLRIVETPQGTEGYSDLVRNASPETVADGVRVEVASLLDLIRIADAGIDPSDRGALPTLRRAYELGRDDKPPGERPIEIPEGLEELFAEHGIR